MGKVDIGHGAAQAVKAFKASADDIFTLKMECKSFVLNAAVKVVESSPFMCVLVRGLSSLDPSQIDASAGLK